jgi:uncharacterized protein YjaZ
LASLAKQRKTADKASESAKIIIGERTHLIVYEKSMADAVPIIKDALKKSAALLEAPADITFKVVATDDKVIRDRLDGSGGSTVTPTNITITVFNENVRSWRDAIVSSVAHEYSHAVRGYSYTDENGKPKVFDLKECLAAEGLAQCFEIEVNGGLILKYTREISRKAAVRAWTDLKGRLGETGLYWAVFEGYGGEFPLWTGYTLAYLIVSRNIKDLGGDWNEITKLDAETLIGDGLNRSG